MRRGEILSALDITEDGLEEAEELVERRKRVFDSTELQSSFDVGDYCIHRNQLIREESQMAISNGSTDWIVIDADPVLETIKLKDEQWNRRVISYEDFINGDFEPMTTENNNPVWRY